MILIYKLTDPRFLLNASLIEIGMILLIIVAMFFVMNLKKWKAASLKKNLILFNQLLDKAILNDELLDAKSVPKALRKMETLLPILERYDQNFTDKVWTSNKEGLIETYLETSYLKRLNSHFWGDRQQALRLIALWPERLFVKETVLPYINDPFYLVRVAASLALVKSNDKDCIEAVLHQMIKEPDLARYPFRDNLIHGSEKVHAILRDIASTSKDLTILAACLDLLSSRVDPDLIPLGITHISSNDANSRLSAVKILESNHSEVGVKALILSLKDADPRVRGRSAEALGNLRLPHLVPDLIPLLQDPDWITRYKTACALKEIGTAGKRALIHESGKLSKEEAAAVNYTLALPEKG